MHEAGAYPGGVGVHFFRGRGLQVTENTHFIFKI